MCFILASILLQIKLMSCFFFSSSTNLMKVAGKLSKRFYYLITVIYPLDDINTVMDRGSVGSKVMPTPPSYPSPTILSK